MLTELSAPQCGLIWTRSATDQNGLIQQGIKQPGTALSTVPGCTIFSVFDGPSAVPAGLEELDDVAALRVDPYVEGIQRDGQPFIRVKMDVPAVGGIQRLIPAGQEGGDLQGIHEILAHGHGVHPVLIIILRAGGIHVLQDKIPGDGDGGIPVDHAVRGFGQQRGAEAELLIKIVDLVHPPGDPHAFFGDPVIQLGGPGVGQGGKGTGGKTDGQQRGGQGEKRFAIHLIHHSFFVIRRSGRYPDCMPSRPGCQCILSYFTTETRVRGFPKNMPDRPGMFFPGSGSGGMDSGGWRGPRGRPPGILPGK